MLHLTRKIGQSICLDLPDGRQIKVTCKRLHRTASGQLRAVLGIEAPTDIPIVREEILPRHRRPEVQP